MLVSDKIDLFVPGWIKNPDGAVSVSMKKISQKISCSRAALGTLSQLFPSFYRRLLNSPTYLEFTNFSHREHKLTEARRLVDFCDHLIQPRAIKLILSQSITLWISLLKFVRNDQFFPIFSNFFPIFSNLCQFFQIFSNFFKFFPNFFQFFPIFFQSLPFSESVEMHWPGSEIECERFFLVSFWKERRSFRHEPTLTLIAVVQFPFFLLGSYPSRKWV